MISSIRFLVVLFSFLVLFQTVYARGDVVAKPNSVGKGKYVQKKIPFNKQTISRASTGITGQLRNRSGQITYLSPSQNETNVPVNANIEVRFNGIPDTTTLNPETIKIFGYQTGEYSFNREIVFDVQQNPIGVKLYTQRNFKIGERVLVVLTKNIRFADSTKLSRFGWDFTCETGHGSGQFMDQINIYTGSQYGVWHVASGDLDNDHDVDLVTANPTENIAVLLNDGTGGFTSNAVYPVPGFPVFVTLQDYNRDHFLDISVVSDSNLYIFYNNGNATFGVPHIYFTPHPAHPWQRAWSIANTDVNRDGLMDIIVGNINGGSFTIFYNDTASSFIRQDVYATESASPEQITTCDYDNDGDVDLLYIDSFNGKVYIYLYDHGIFTFSQAIQTSGQLNSIYCNDFTNEGFVDILMGTGFYSPTDDKIITILRDGINTNIHNYTVLENPNYAIGTDLNSDGYLDVICAHNATTANNNISILLNDGSGLLGSPNYIGQNLYSPFAVTAADFNNDQTIDFAVANAGSYRVSVLFNQPVVGVELPGSNGITDFELSQNYPNPFNPATSVEFRIRKAEWVTLTIYDILGRKVKTLVNERKAPGSYTMLWNGTNDAGQPVASGVYLYRLQAVVPSAGSGQGYTAVRKMLLIR